MPNFSVSPSTNNYTLPTGIFSFKPDGDSDYRDLGAVSNASMTITTTTIEHKIARNGVISTDFTQIASVSASGKATLDELSPENWSLFLLADPVLNTDGSYSVEMLSNSSKAGYLKFVGDNDVGVQYSFEAYVTLQPSGDVTILDAEASKVATLPIDFKVNTDPVTGKYPTFTFAA